MNKELRNQVKTFLEENGKSASMAAKGIGYSASALSQWLSFSYKGDVKKFEAAVENWLARQIERQQRTVIESDFVHTSIAKKVFEYAEYCLLENEIGVVYGPAGLGKTFSVKEFHRLNPSTILIEADLGYTAKVLFQEMHKIVGLDGHGSIHSLFEDVVSRLKGTDRMIIVDEAEHLPYRALELLRRVYDKAGVGILLIGMPTLIGNLRGKRGEYAQLYSRVGVKCALQVLDPSDTELFVKNALPGSNGIHKTFHQVANGNTRVLSKLIRRSIRMSEINHLPIDKPLVEEAGKSLII
jgi:DNA transposition AAA+ family ATPase